jgi:hypothetical protein
VDDDVELDPELRARAERMARRRGITLEELTKEAVDYADEHLPAEEPPAAEQEPDDA